MIKKHFWKILLVILSSINNLYGKPEVVDWKVLSDTSFNVAGVIIDRDNGVIVKGGHNLWMNNNQVKLDRLGSYWNSYVEYGQAYIVFHADKQHIAIYSVDKEVTLRKRIAIGDFPLDGFSGVISVPGDNNSLYLFGSREQFARNPVAFMYDIISGGHGRRYCKPVLAEIQNETLLKYKKIPYGGKIDESYYAKEVLVSNEVIHLFGLRRKAGIPDILSYVEYDVKRGNIVKTQDIYEKYSSFEQKDDGLIDHYWHVSADNFNDNLFVVFSWNGIHCFSQSTNIKVENANSPIYYSQSDGTVFGKVEMIGQGILPLVKIDFFGNVHVVWVNSNGALVHKAKTKGMWNNEQIIMNGIDPDYVWDRMYENISRFKKINAEFDKNNNLNVVFQSNGNLVLAKIKFD